MLNKKSIFLLAKFSEEPFENSFNNFGELNSNLEIEDTNAFNFPSSPQRKSIRFSVPKKSSEGFFWNPQQTPHFSVEYKSEGFGDDKKMNYSKFSVEKLVKKI
jgi:hypothetical protein